MLLVIGMNILLAYEIFGASEIFGTAAPTPEYSNGSGVRADRSATR